MNLIIDFETRSPVDLKSCGGYVYAAHPDTEIMMLAVLVDNEPGRVWVAPKFRHLCPTEIEDYELTELIKEADKIAAHNAPFERAVWKHKMEALGFPILDVNKAHCTMARALMCGLPRNLEQAMKAWGSGVEKDKVGHKLMMKMVKPRKFRKAELKELSDKFNKDPQDIKSLQEHIYGYLSDGSTPEIKNYHDFVIYHESEKDFRRLVEYARQDVIAEKVLFDELPQMPESERKVWLFDQMVNDRGIGIDVEAVKEIRATILKYDEQLTQEALELTNGEVPSMKSSQSICSWLESQGTVTSTVDKWFVEDTLKRDDLSPEVRRFLEIRQALGKSSNAKYQAMLRTSAVDGRARGVTIYHGATTGRFSGALFQPQNLPRTSTNNLVYPEYMKVLPDGNKPDEYFMSEGDISLLRSGDFDMMGLWWKKPMILASDAIRPMIVAKDGYDFVTADFSAIEGRGLAWLAGEESVLEGYRQGLDPYRVAAAGIYKISYDEVDGGGKGKQRQVGKTAELACGYGGGYSAMLRFGADRMGVDEEEGNNIVKSWRAARPGTVKLWYGIVESCVNAFKTNRTHCYRGVAFQRGKRFMTMVLPSGRRLFYPDPKLEKVEMGWSTPEKPAFKELVTAMTLTATKQYVRRPLNHLILSENATQAICRDLLVEAMFRLEENGYPVVMHVHDEVVSEVPEGFGSLKEFEEIMCAVPEWAKGFPIKAEGWRGKRYRK